MSRLPDLASGKLETVIFTLIPILVRIAIIYFNNLKAEIKLDIYQKSTHITK